MLAAEILAAMAAGDDEVWRSRNMTPKQRRFVDEYLIDLNATAAAKRAGYSQRTARSQAERLLTNVDIARRYRGGQGGAIETG